MSQDINLATCTEEELWRHVATRLEADGIPVVLVGGAVVAIYSRGAYRSGDLDFVPEGLFMGPVEESMAQLGFRRRGGHFEHPDCHHLFVEFVRPPLGIGNDLDIRPRVEACDGRELKILSPTDCVRDRLASFIHFKARECLDQALLVATAQEGVNLSRVRSWCVSEGRAGELAFEEFIRLLEST